MGHRVEIGALETLCHVTGPKARREDIRRAVDLSCRESLPRALKTDLDHALAGHSGVIRIRRLDVNWHSFDPLAANLASEISAEIARRLRAALAVAEGHIGTGHRSGIDLRHWPDHAAFMADFVLFRLGLTADDPWPYRDFAALDTLSGPEAAFEILTARPETLRALAHHKDADALVPRLIAALLPAQQARLIRRLSTATSAESLKTVWHALPAPLKVSLTKTMHAEGRAEARILARLLSILARASTRPENANIPALCALVQTIEDLKTIAAATAFKNIGSWTAFLTDLSRSAALSAEQAVALSRLTPCAETQDGEALLNTLTDALSVRPDDLSGTASKATKTNTTGPIQSGYAGLALLVPSFLALGGAALTGAERASALLACLPEDNQRQAARDSGVDLLLPYDPQTKPRAATDWPLPSGEKGTDQDPAARWAKAILADFADHLPGLSGSSPGYLAMQFLARPGQIERTKIALHVTLSPLPLSIVLTMGGHFGARGALPWHENRALILSLSKGP